MRHWRKMTWVLWAWVALTGLFIVGVNTWANNAARTDCVGDSFECDTAVSIASAFWTATGIVVGFLGFFALGLIWLMTKPRGAAQHPTPLAKQPPAPLAAQASEAQSVSWGAPDPGRRFD